MHWDRLDGTSMWSALATITLGIFSQITLNHAALVATILAALSTFAYNGYKLYKDIKNKNNVGEDK
jgi:hypothetical protein